MQTVNINEASQASLKSTLHNVLDLLERGKLGVMEARPAKSDDSADFRSGTEALALILHMILDSPAPTIPLGRRSHSKKTAKRRKDWRWHLAGAVGITQDDGVVLQLGVEVRGAHHGLQQDPLGRRRCRRCSVSLERRTKECIVPGLTHGEIVENLVAPMHSETPSFFASASQCIQEKERLPWRP